MYVICACVSLLAAVLSSLNHLSRLLGFYSGPKQYLWLLLATQSFATLLGVVMWLGETKAGEDLRIGLGAKMAIAALCASLLSASLLVYSQIQSNAGVRPMETIGNCKVLGLSLRQWLLVKSLPLLGLAALFDIIAIRSYWVRFSTSSHHYGSLFAIDRLLSYEEVTYSCVRGALCDLSAATLETQRSCASFPRLDTAASVFLVFDSLSFTLALLWTETNVYFIAGREYGIPVLNYIWPSAAVLLKVTGCISWFAITSASFLTACESSGDDEIHFCAHEGPVLVLYEVLCLGIAAAFFTAVYRRRHLSAAMHCGLPSSQSLIYDEPVKRLSSSPCEKSVSIRLEDGDRDSRCDAAGATSAPKTAEDTMHAHECIACLAGRELDDIRFELPCGHWCHIECFARLGYNRKNCQKCQERPSSSS